MAIIIYNNFNSMEAVLIVPKEVAFNSVNGVEKLTLENQTDLKLAVKVKPSFITDPNQSQNCLTHSSNP